MQNPKFRVGQMVDFKPARAGIQASVRAYKILRLLPHVGAECHYQIKTISEAFAQIAEESELVRNPLM